MIDMQFLYALVAFARAHPVLTALLLALYVAAQAWQRQPKEWRVAVTANNPRATAVFDLVNALAGNVVSAFRIVYYRLIQGIPSRPDEHDPRAVGSLNVPVSAPTVRETLAPVGDATAIELAANAEPYQPSSGTIASDDSEPGFATLRLLAVIALVCIAVLVVGCPRLPDVDGCAPLAVRCSPNGVPQLCDPDTRWTPVDEQCSRYGNECVVTRAYSSRTIAVCLSPNDAREAHEVNDAP